MARRNFAVVVLMVVAALGGSAFAQSNEIAGLWGRTFIGNQKVSGSVLANPDAHFGDSNTYEALFAHRFFNAGILGISVEVPFVIDPNNRLQYGGNITPKSFTSYFVTPAARVSLFPSNAFSPWVSVGGGIGHFNPSSTLEFGGANPGTANTTGVFEIGGGLDVRIAGGFKLRGEIRDFESGEPSLNINPNSRYNNIFAGAGVVFSF
jgi:hypothetical protein